MFQNTNQPLNLKTNHKVVINAHPVKLICEMHTAVEHHLII